MSLPVAPSRRRFLGLLVSTAVAALLPRPVPGGPLDQGIGGTGAAPPTEESDRGIGGTGVIGTIRKFGSIVVNDLRISYPPDVAVRIDGEPARVADLELGQVVRVSAAGESGALSTRTIDVTHEVVGPIERIKGKSLVVLGQSVRADGPMTRGLKVGDTAAVSGLRRNDGSIVASRVERRDGASPHVAGPVALGDNGGLRIGNLPLSGVDPSLIGRRAVLSGDMRDGRFAVVRGTSEATLLPDVRTLSIESYVERRGGRLALGSGFAVTEADRLDLPTGRSVRAVVTTTIGADGRLYVDSLRAGGRTYGGGQGRDGQGRGGQGERAGQHGGHRPGGRAEPGPDDRGGHAPMDFGRGRATEPGAFGGGNAGGGFPPSSRGGFPGGNGMPGGGMPGGGMPGGGMPGGGGFGGGPPGGSGGGRR